MEINKHICFREDEHPDLIRYLQENGIAFDKGDSSCVLDIYESNSHWGDIGNYVQDKGLFCLSETIFSKEELRKAEWLRVRSQWRCGYPQPEDGFGYETITYSREKYCDACGTGLVQTGSFQMKKAPKWGRRHFMMLNWVADELFLSEEAKTILKNTGVSGISFCEVKNKNGSEVFPGIYQMIIPFLLGKGLVKDRPSIRDVKVCPQCEIKKYGITGVGMLAFRKEIFDNVPDIVKTEEVFGWGHSAPRIIIVRQKVYQTIIANQLERGLVFEPIELV